MAATVLRVGIPIFRLSRRIESRQHHKSLLLLFFRKEGLAYRHPPVFQTLVPQPKYLY